MAGPYVCGMRTLAMCFWLSSCVFASAACHDDEDPSSNTDEAYRPSTIAAAHVEQIKPPLDLRRPPADAEKTSSGLVYKTLVANGAGVQPKRNATVLIQYTGWNQRTGTTFFSTRGRGQPISIDLSHAVPGVADALPLLHKGEKAVLWMPTSPVSGDPLVYEVELVDVVSPPTLATRASTDAVPVQPTQN
jgi:hypothetical protein